MISVTESRAPAREVSAEISGLHREVERVVNMTAVIDVHTHLFPPAFSGLFLQGIDDLLNYHYLIAEFFRSTTLSHETFWQLTKTERADLVWRTVFVENTPLHRLVSCNNLASSKDLRVI